MGGNAMIELLARRRVGQEKGMLPYDAQVEYLQSSGTQYIDTGLYGDIDLDYEVKAQRTDSVRWNYVLGNSRTSNSDRYTLLLDGNGKVYFNCGDKNNEKNTSISVTTARIYKKTGLNVYIDGTSKATFSSQTFTTPNTLTLFGVIENGAEVNMMTGRIYYCKFFRNGVIVADFIPVRKNGIGYMYDKVSGNLFGNVALNSAFTYGNDV